MEQIAEVYARSLFEIADEQGKIPVIREQLGAFADALSESRDLQVFFFSPYFATREKEEVLGRTIEGADPVFENFLRVLIEKRRMPVLMRIRRLFDRMAEADEGILPVQITSAIELDPATAQSLEERVRTQTGRTTRLSTVVDPEILGGVVLRVGNQILDASIRTRLERLREQVVTGA